MSNRLFFSRFTHNFINENVYAVFNSLRMRPIYINSDIFKVLITIQDFDNIETFLASIQEKEIYREIEITISALQKNKVLIDSPDYDDKIIQHFRQATNPPYIQIAYFMLSDLCNFNCTYCFIKKPMPSSYKAQNMSLDVAFKALDMYCSLINKTPERFDEEKTIIFYGGEPLLNTSVLFSLLERINLYKEGGKLPHNLQLSLITNGSLFTHDIVERLNKFGVAISISLDGDTQESNSSRIYENSYSPYNDILQGIEVCQNEGANLSLSITLTEETLKRSERNIELLLEKYGIKSIGFNMLLTDDNNQISSLYNEKASIFMINSFEHFRQKGIYEDRIMRKAQAFSDSEVYTFDCGATGGNQIVIAPDGQIGICHGFLGSRKFFVTDVDNLNFDPPESSVYQEWNKRTPLNMEQCQSCSALGICGGGCPLNSFNNKGSIWELDERFCVHAKMTLEWLIWDLYKKCQSSHHNITD